MVGETPTAVPLFYLLQADISLVLDRILWISATMEVRILTCYFSMMASSFGLNLIRFCILQMGSVF